MPKAGTSLRLTQMARGGGCACKLPPGELEDVLSQLPSSRATNLLVGLGSGDDAAVVGLDETRAVIATADFFTPVVDDRRAMYLEDRMQQPCSRPSTGDLVLARLCAGAGTRGCRLTAWPGSVSLLLTLPFCACPIHR
jgi:hypothetical protein